MPNNKEPQGRIFRSSKQRDLIVEVFTKSAAHLSAEDVYQAVRIAQPRISLGTVYRNLDILVEMGLVNKAVFMDGKARYEFAQKGHHHHLLCLGCGYIQDIAECPVVNDAVYIQEKNFKVVQHYLEISGYCAECQKKIISD